MGIYEKVIEQARAENERTKKIKVSRSWADIDLEDIDLSKDKMTLADRIRSIANCKMHNLSVKESNAVKAELFELAEELDKTLANKRKLIEIRNEIDQLIRS